MRITRKPEQRKSTNDQSSRKDIKKPDSNRSHSLLAYANELTQEGLVARSEALNSVFANMIG